MEERNTVMIAARVSPTERAAIGAVASLTGKNISTFLRDLVVPVAMRELERTARAVANQSPVAERVRQEN